MPAALLLMGRRERWLTAAEVAENERRSGQGGAVQCVHHRVEGLQRRRQRRQLQHRGSQCQREQHADGDRAPADGAPVLRQQEGEPQHRGDAQQLMEDRHARAR